jgi:hypothetical protein
MLVVTKKEEKNFIYASSRDVSGLFRLNLDQISCCTTAFVKIDIKFDFQLFEDGTKLDYEFQKERLLGPIINNRRAGETFVGLTDMIIPGFAEDVMVQIGERRPPCISARIFDLSIVFGLAQFYKLYVDSFCVEKNFLVLKQISTKDNLNDVKFDDQFHSCNPGLFMNKQIMFENRHQLSWKQLDQGDFAPIATGEVVINMPIDPHVNNDGGQAKVEEGAIIKTESMKQL